MVLLEVGPAGLAEGFPTVYRLGESMSGIQGLPCDGADYAVHDQPSGLLEVADVLVGGASELPVGGDAEGLLDGEDGRAV